MRISPGTPYPLGATWDGQGINFALFSEVAEGVDLCLFDPARNKTRIALTEVDSYVWQGYVPGVHPGQHYGYRVHGSWDPIEGRVCNPHKLLLDPYAKAVQGRSRARSAMTMPVRIQARFLRVRVAAQHDGQRATHGAFGRK